MNDMSKDPATILDVVDRELLVSEMRASIMTTFRTRLARERARKASDAFVMDSDLFLSICDELARNTAQAIAVIEVKEPAARQLDALTKLVHDREAQDLALVAELRRQIEARDRQIADLLACRGNLEARLRHAEENAAEPLTS